MNINVKTRFCGLLIIMNDAAISRELLSAILESSRASYPREMILLLRGKVEKNTIKITDFVAPPLAIHGDGFSGFRPSMLPIDFSIIGSVHSHPSGNQKPETVKFDHLRVNSSKNTRAMVKTAPCTLACTATLAGSKKRLKLKMFNIEFPEALRKPLGPLYSNVRGARGKKSGGNRF